MIIGINGRIGAGKDTLGKAIQYLNLKDTFPYNKMSFQELVERHHYPALCWDDSGWQIKKYATKLKLIAGMLLGVDPIKFEDQEYKNSTLGSQWDYWTTEGYYDNQWAGKESGRMHMSEQEALGFAMLCEMEENTPIQRHQMTVREFLQKLGTDAMRMGLHPNVWVNALMADYKPSHMHSVNPDFEKYPDWIITDVRFPNEAEAIKERGGIVVRIDRLFNPYPKSNHISEVALNNWEFDYKFAVGEGYEGTLIAAQEILSKV